MAERNNTVRFLQLVVTIVVIVAALIAGYYVQQAQLRADMKDEYYTKEVVDLKFAMLLDRLERMDGKLDQLLEDR